MILKPEKDRILPHCADDRHPKDARFLLCEEDFRFYFNDLINHMIAQGVDFRLFEEQVQLLQEKDVVDPE